jgi:hypothetical protein
MCHVKRNGIKAMRKMMIHDLRTFCKVTTAAVFALLFVTCYSLLVTSHSYAGIHDRVIAFVDNQAITLSDLEEQYRNTVKLSPDITNTEVLNTMINRILLLREAKRYRIEAATQDDVMREFIDLKIRAFIRVGEGDMERFYQENVSKFSGRGYEDAREEIERYLTEKELNEKLKAMLNELREKAYIKIFLHGEQGT